MRARYHVAVLVILLMMLPGCLSMSEETLGGVGTYEVEATWTTVELETKTAFYADDEAVTWSVTDGELDQQIEDAGGHVVGLVLAMSYPADDESPSGLCTGQETDVPDIVSGTATKGEWTLEASDSGFGGHEVNLTWHDQAILDAGVATNLSEQGVICTGAGICTSLPSGPICLVITSFASAGGPAGGPVGTEGTSIG